MGVRAPPGLRALVGTCDVVLCDVYGTIDDGAQVFPDAAEALRLFRAAGGVVILVSNSPQPGAKLARDLSRRGLPDDARDDVVTSADIARALLTERGAERAHHIGPAADRALFDGLGIMLQEAEASDVAVCTGYPTDEPSPALERVRDAGLDLLCTNPDTSVTVDDRVLRFAGLVASAYRELGGSVIETGKPAEAIYAGALAAAAAITGREHAPDRVAGIGDSYPLDVAGAVERGFRGVWIDGSARQAPNSGEVRAERWPRLSW